MTIEEYIICRIKILKEVQEDLIEEENDTLKMIKDCITPTPYMDVFNPALLQEVGFRLKELVEIADKFNINIIEE